MRFCKYFGLLGASTLAYAAPAFCQIAADRAAAPDEPQNADIVVTGTLIRGVEPTGTTVIGIDRSAVEASGATTVTQLLQTVPQFGSFNTAQAPQGGGTTVTTNRPNLRDLASSNTNGASATLLLIDGHRVVGMGIQTTSPDLDTIAPGAIERVDVVPDGGSSIYGADAVGGVVNFITRKTFSGLGVDGRFGFADEYRSWDVNATVGTTWTGGGVYASYNYSKHDAIFGRDRDWVRQFPTQSAAFAVPVIGVECKTPNVQIVNNPNIYGLPLVPTAAARLNQPNQCDYSDFATVYPKERRHAVFASLTQELSDSLDFELKGFFMDRKQRAVTGYLRATKNLGTSPGQLNSPFRSQFIINSATESQRVSFGFGADDANRQEIHLQTWGVTPTFTARLGGNWQARVLLNYGESTTTVHSPTFNDPALNNAITAGLFNPYNPASSNSAASAAISNFEVFGQAKQSQLQARAVLDGDLFELPGGAVKLAVGGEFLHETLRTQKGNAVPGFQTTGFSGQSINGSLIVPAQARLPILHASREVKSVFGELVVPLLADTALFQELTLSASGRYDDYSDFGDTFNPKFGLTWKPFDRLRIRGQWGKSFSAPSLANSADADPATATWSTGSIFNIFVSAAGINALKARGYPAPTAANSTMRRVKRPQAPDRDHVVAWCRSRPLCRCPAFRHLLEHQVQGLDSLARGHSRLQPRELFQSVPQFIHHQPHAGRHPGAAFASDHREWLALQFEYRTSAGLPLHPRIQHDAEPRQVQQGGDRLRCKLRQGVRFRLDRFHVSWHVLVDSKTKCVRDCAPRGPDQAGSEQAADAHEPWHTHRTFPCSRHVESHGRLSNLTRYRRLAPLLSRPKQNWRVRYVRPFLQIRL